MNHFVRLLCLLLLPLSSPAQDQATNRDLSGYVTRISSPSDFDVTGTHVMTSAETSYGIRGRKQTLSTRTPLPLSLGQTVDIVGKRDKKHHAFAAEYVFLRPQIPLPVSGAGMVDLLAPASATPGDRTLRADGYLLRIGPGTTLTFVPPLDSSTALSTNLWISYHGVQQTDGTVLLDRAELRANEIKPAEDKLRTGDEYDPAAVDPNARQGFFSKGTFGVDPQLIPPYAGNAPMQERLVRIGNSLVPAYQRKLPETDPTRIHFRFQLIDQPRWHDALTLSSGIILVPYQVIDRLANDSQIAAVLADNIARAIEKQTLRSFPADNAMTAVGLAGTAAGLIVPGLGLATEIGTAGAGAHLASQEQQQSGRVSLSLLHDAGYDLSEAPIAWWLLAPSKPTAISSVPIPPRSAYLYLALGTTWRETLSPSKPREASVAQPSPTP